MTTNGSLGNIEKLEKDLWEAADNLRANSKLTSSEYCMPVLGVIFLRHAANRFEAATTQIAEDQAAGRMPKRKAIAADFVKRRCLYLPEESRYDTILATPKDGDLSTALVNAMTAIEDSFEPLKGVLPKDFSIFERTVLEDLLKIFNREALRSTSGDIFGRIYEYFLMKFAMQGAQDNGEFFTPPSLVQTIVNVIEPDHGVVADLACGSGGMFVQSSHFIEHLGQDTMKRVTFYGQEKTATTIRLAKMNLAVHGLEGDIREANTFYDDVHRLPDGRSLWGNCDFGMANPPFNVDQVDAEKIKDDRRLPFGLPGVNKSKKVSNGNYLWISYFHSYLGAKGRAGFVMSSQASSAGHGEAEVRRRIVEAGDVDVMISIRSNFFYTRTVPCELWHFDKGKPADRRDSVLMLDARNIYRKVTRKIYDFSPEQLANLTAIVWLYRGERARFIALLLGHRSECGGRLALLHHAFAPFKNGEDCLHDLDFILACIKKAASMYLSPDAPAEKKDALLAMHDQLLDGLATVRREGTAYFPQVETARYSLEDGASIEKHGEDAALGRVQAVASRLEPFMHETRRVVHLLQTFWKELSTALDLAEALITPDFRKNWRKEWGVREKQQAEAWPFTEAPLREGELRYHFRHLQWVLHRFPEGRYCDVPGLCKAVTRAEIATADWSLTPGRYVGVAAAEVDEDFDFEQTLGDIHVELADLDQEAAALAKKIQKTLRSWAYEVARM